MLYWLKSVNSILGKLEKRGLEVSLDSIVTNLTDIAGVRVICNYVSDVYKIADLLIKQSDIKLIAKKDYIKHPKENGYRSLHLVVEVPIFLAEKVQPTTVEIQIRTIAMDFWASLEHHLRYKAAMSEYIEYYNNDRINTKRKGMSQLAYRQQSFQDLTLI